MDERNDPVLSFVRLLTSDASGDQLKAALAAIYDSRLPLNVSEFNKALAESLNVLNFLQRQRRQALELAALHDTAMEMSATDDMAGVLRAICRRARTLIGTDVAYVALHEPDTQVSSIRATEGVVSRGFLGLQLPRGAGIGGLVAETGEPIWTADYLDDARFVHTQHLDRAVSSESLRALIGVPIWADAEQMGLLMAGNRDPRPFGQEDISLLRSLAAHAAVAIHSARTFEATQRAVQELALANELVRDHSETIERAAAMHERLMAVLVEGGDMPEILAHVADLVGGHIAVLDSAGTVMAACGDPIDRLDEVLREGSQLSRNGKAPAALWQAITTDGDAVSTVVQLPDGYSDRTVAHLRARSELLGALVVTRPTMTDGDLRNLERAAMIISLLLVNQGALAEAELRARGDLIYDVLVREHADADDLLLRSARSGLHLEQPHVVLCASLESPTRGPARLEADQIVANLGGIAGVVEGRLVFVVAGDDAEQIATDVHRRFAHAHLPATVSCGGPARGVLELRSAYQDAIRAQQLLHALGLQRSVGTAETLGIYGLILHGSAPGELKVFIDSRIGGVREYDDRHGTQLQLTLKRYLDNEGHLARTASEMHVHVNTLYSRLSRLDAILGEDWRDPDRRIQIHLALRLSELTARISPGSLQSSPSS